MKNKFGTKGQRICRAAGALLFMVLCRQPQALHAQAYNRLERVGQWQAAGPVMAVAFSPDDKLLAGATRGMVTLWNSAGQEVKEFPFVENHGAAPTADDSSRQSGRSVAVRQVAFSPDGKVLAAVGAASSVRLWDVTSGRILFDLYGHDRSGARTIAFSPGGALLATGGYDKVIKLWDVQSGGLVRTIEGHSGLISSLAFDRDGRALTSISADKIGAANCELKRWETASGKLLNGGTLDYVDPYTVVLSPNGRFVCSQIFDPVRPRPTQDRISDGIRIWDAQTGTLLRSTRGTAGFKGASTLAFSPGGTIVANVISSEYGGQEGPGLSLWDLRTGRSLVYEGDAPRRIQIQAQPLSLTFTRDARAIAVGCGDSTVQVWALPE